MSIFADKSDKPTNETNLLPGTIVRDKPYRSIVKTISWRATGTVDTFVISYLLTGSFGIAASIGGTELLTKMVLYYFHERIWDRLKFGKEIVPPPEYEI